MKNKFSLEWILDEYSYFFNMINIPISLVREKYIEFSEKQTNNNGKDFLWSLFQFLIIETSNNSKDEHEMYSRHEQIYYKMTSFRRKYENSKSNDILQLGFDSYLNSLEPIGNIRMKVQIISGHCCDYCNSLNGKRIDLEDAKKNRYLASEKCTREYGCNCCYGYSPELDENGNLIFEEEN